MDDFLTELSHRLSVITRDTPGYTTENISAYNVSTKNGSRIAVPSHFDIDNKLVCGRCIGNGNILCAAGSTARTIVFSFVGNNNLIYCGGNSGYAGKINVWVKGSNQVLYIGDRCEINGLSVVLVGDGTRIIIGDESLMSFGVVIRTHDEHAILDISNNEVINHPADITIEPHVWLGKDASIHGGVRLGFGSIVGERALVKNDVPRFSLVAGVPARVLREGVSWSNPIIPAAGHADRLKDFERQLPKFSGERPF